MDFLTRFHSKIELKNNGCHEWTASKNGNGYGQFGIGEKVVQSHRLSYELYKGEISKGLELDHLCMNRACVNPSHLEAIKHKENLKRGVNFNKSKTHCPQGHEYSKKNTHVGKNNKRRCRICLKIQKRISRQWQ